MIVVAGNNLHHPGRADVEPVLVRGMSDFPVADAEVAASRPAQVSDQDAWGARMGRRVCVS